MKSLKELIIEASKVGVGSKSEYCIKEGKNFTVELKENSCSWYMFIYENFDEFQVLQVIILYNNDFFTIIYKKEDFYFDLDFITEECCLENISYTSFLRNIALTYNIKGLLKDDEFYIADI